MLQQQRTNSRGEKYVIGPTGAPLTLSDLPPPETQRWVIRRKAEVVAAVRGGLLSLDEACDRYKLTNDEFLSWQQSIDRHGLAGLRTTRIQQYRSGKRRGCVNVTTLQRPENPAGLAPEGFEDVQRPLPKGGGRDVLAPPEPPRTVKYKRLVYLVLGKSCLPTNASCSLAGRSRKERWDQR
jgi:hypothetical protein